MRMLFKWKMIEQWTTIEAISEHGMASPKAGIFRETGFWYSADLCVSTVDTSLDINEVILCTDNHTTYDRFYSHHGSHNGYMWVWYPSIILNWIWILVLIRWQASLYISSLRVKTFVTYESWGSTSLQVSSHWSNLHWGLKPQTWQDKWQSKILKSSQPTTHARKVKLVVSRRNQSMSILQVLKCFETKNINKNETVRTSANCHTCQDQGSPISTCFAWQGLCHENVHPAISHGPWACWFGLRRL